MVGAPLPWCAVEALTDDHRVHDFTCGNEEADSWLKQKAAGQVSRVATHVAVDGNGFIVGFFAFKTVAILDEEMSNAMRGSSKRKTAFLLCWIAINTDHQGSKLFVALLWEAWRMAAAAHRMSPVDLFVLDPMTERLSAEYKKFGFRDLKSGSTRLGMKMSKVRDILARLDAAPQLGG